MVEYKSYPTWHDHEWRADSALERVIDALRSLPKHALIRWHDLVYADGVYQGAIDVWAPAVSHPAGLGWAWTIHEDWKGPVSDDEQHGLSIHITPDTTSQDGEAAWYPETVSRALQEWAATHADRDDLRFISDPSLVTALARVLEEAKREAEIDPKLYTIEDLQGLEYQDEVVMEVLRRLPKNSVINWHDDVAYRNGTYRVSIDVWAPSICEAAGLNQVWMIDDSGRECDCPEGVGLDLYVPRDSTIDSHPVWRPETISRVLEAWAVDHAHRPDLRFEVDVGLESPMARRLRDFRRL